MTSSLCIFLCMSRCLMPQCFLYILSLFERFFLLSHHSLYSFSPWRTILSSPCFLETSLTLTELITPSSLFFQTIVQILHLYNIIFAFVPYHNYLSYFLYPHSKFFEVSNHVRFILNTLIDASIQTILKKFVELIWIRLFW